MSSPRSLPSSFEAYARRTNANETCQRRSLSQRPTNNDNNNNNVVSPPRISKLTVSSSNRASPASSDVLNQPLCHQLEHGDGEEQQRRLLVRNVRGNGQHAQLSALFPLCRRSSSDHILFMDPNANPIYDEALSFVSISKNFLATRKSEICAEFVNEHFKCPVCLDVLIESTVVTCGHRFCRDCIEKWLHIKSTCPVCQKYVTIQLQQYDVDNVISSVAHWFPPEWHTRRSALLKSHENSPTSTSFLLSSSNWLTEKLDEICDKSRHVFQRGSRLFHRHGERLAEGILWLHEHTTLESVVKGMVLGSLGAILWFAGDQFLNFFQYVFYVMINYDKNAPAQEQIKAVTGKLAEISGHRLQRATKYAEFVGLNDTVYAAFIRLFWNWKEK